jgi:Flp pilus assembly protein TadD
MKRLSIILLILSICLLATACRSTSTAEGNYKTVSANPQRNTALAQREYAKAMALAKQDQPDKAIEHLKRALKADIMFGLAHNNLGKLYYQQKRYYEAAWEFEYAAKLMPHRPEPRSNLGMVFEAVGRTSKAVDHYAKAMELEPDNAYYIGNLARARLRRGDRDATTRDLLQALVLKDTRPTWITWARETLLTMPVQ